MAPITFILTRTFIISSLVISALPTVFAAPTPVGDAVVVEKRYLASCGYGACNFAKPSPISSGVVATSTPGTVSNLADAVIAAVVAVVAGQDKDTKTQNFVHAATTNGGKTDDGDKLATTVKVIELSILGAGSSNDKIKANDVGQPL